MTQLDDCWKILKGTIDGRPASVRFNSSLASFADSGTYPEELIVSVRLKEPTERGMPSSGEVEELHRLEDAIRPALQEGLASVLAVVMTTAGFRDFIFYTRSPHEAVQRLQELQPAFKAMAIDVRSCSDKNWTQFRRFAKVVDRPPT